MASKEDLKQLVEQIAVDVTGGRDIDPTDTFLIQILGDYAARVLVGFDAEFGWDAPRMSDSTEDAFLSFLAKRWVFHKITGRLR